MATNAAHNRLVNRIAAMIANETYNDAPVNYSIAEKAIAMTERSLERRAAGREQRKP